MCRDFVYQERGKMAYTVYKHTSPSGKVYIGITSSPVNRRWQNGKGYRQNKYFSSAISKYGWDNFDHEIVCTNLSSSEAFEMEKLLIRFYNSTDRRFGYNQSTGGESGACGVHPSQETIEKLRIASTGRKRGAEELKKFSEKMRGHPVSKETREKISNSLKGKPHKHSQETLRKIAIANGKPVICIETGEIFCSVADASRSIGKSYSSVWNVVAGKKITAGGFHWKYLEGAKNDS